LTLVFAGIAGRIENTAIGKLLLCPWEDISLIFKEFMDGKLLKSLSGNALKLYIFLGLYSKNQTGECWPSVQTIAEYFGKSERTVYNSNNKPRAMRERTEQDVP